MRSHTVFIVPVPARRHSAHGGFTLMEMMVVIGIISLIVAIALPQLAPVIAMTGHDGSARRIAGYGRSAIARAQLLHERMTVKVDLKNQEFWSERWPDPEIVAEEKEKAENPETSNVTPMSPLEMLSLAKAAEDPESEVSEEDYERLDAATNEMYKKFDRMSRQASIVRAKRVSHKSSVLDNFDPLFERGFTLDDKVNDEDLEPEEILEPILMRTRMPSGIFIDSVSVGDKRFTNGLVEIPISPLGLEEDVVFRIGNDEGDFYTVEWDPTTGGARSYSEDD